MTEHWLTADETAAYLNITSKGVRKNANSGKYGQVRFEENSGRGGKDGRIMMIPLSGLPEFVRKAYLYDHGFSLTTPSEEDSWDKEPEWKREKATQCLMALNAWEQYLAINQGSKVDLSTEFVRNWNIANPDNSISVQSLYRWRKDYRAGGRMALIPGWGESKRDRQIDPEAFQYFMKLYGTKNQRKIADCYFDLVEVSDEKGWRIPSLRTLQRIVQEDVPVATLVLLREGEEAFRNKCQPYILRDPETVKANQVWVGDHYRMDMFVKGPNGKPVRPWVTGWVDFRSRKFLGWIISYGGNTDTIMASFAKPAMDKTIGLPGDIYIDNGQDYSSHEFAGRGHRHQAKKVDEERIMPMVQQFGIVPHFAIPKNARAKIIERQFRVASEKFCKRYPTYCGSDNKERPEGLTEFMKDHPDQVPTLEQIQTEFSEWITYIYNKLPSEGKGRQGECPDQTFERTRGPIRLATESQMRLCFMRHSKPLTVHGNGVQFFGNWYFDPCLVIFQGKKINIRYREDDMTKVFAFSLKDEFIGEVKMKKALPVLGASKEDIRAANQEAKQVKRIAKEYAAMSAEVAAEPDHLARIIARKKRNASKPEAPKIVQPVRVAPSLAAAAKEMELAEAVGAGGRVNRNTMQAYKQMLFNQTQTAAPEDRAQKALALLRNMQQNQ